jgi:hypothetical protein
VETARFLRSGFADGFFKAPQLVKMMADVDDVEAAPLIGTQRTEDKMGGDALQAEAMAAAVQEGVHLIDFLAEKLKELGTVHGRPMQLIGPRKNRSGRAARHLAEREHDHLQKPLNRTAVIGGGPAALKALLQYAAGTAAGEHQVLDDLLSTPQTVVLAGMQLAPFRRLAR